MNGNGNGNGDSGDAPLAEELSLSDEWDQKQREADHAAMVSFLQRLTMLEERQGRVELKIEEACGYLRAILGKLDGQ